MVTEVVTEVPWITCCCSMSASSRSENVIEYTEKEQELHHQVEKLDIVPQETECVSWKFHPSWNIHREHVLLLVTMYIYKTDLVLYGFSVQDCFNVNVRVRVWISCITQLYSVNQLHGRWCELH